MRDSASDDPLINPAAASNLSDEEWVALHVPRFEKIRPNYAIYASFLDAVLKEACRTRAPLAIVTARPKGISSFAEKIIRKRKEYVCPKDLQPPDPIVRVTDLCGARVIAQTADQVQALCTFVEQAFHVDWANSVDASRRLRPTEFGYRSIHFIVQVDPEKLKAAGIETEIPTDVQGRVCPERETPIGLKAEIQVRTLLEHAAADVAHDVIYKTEVKVPDRLHRKFARICATLESADQQFADLLHDLAQFKTHYGAFHTRAEVQNELAVLRAVLAYSPNPADLAVRIAQLALAIGEHETAEETLRPYAEMAHPGVQRVLGKTLCERHGDQPRSAAYREGVRFLQAAGDDQRTDAESLCALAEALTPLDDCVARDGFCRAAMMDGSEPLTLCRYLEFEVAHLGNDLAVRLAAPLIRTAMERCHKQIEGQVNLPTAWSCLAVFYLVLGQPFDALHALVQVIRLCQPLLATTDDSRASARPCSAGRALLRLRDSLLRFKCIRERLTGFDWLQRLLFLGLAVRLRDDAARQTVNELASSRVSGARPSLPSAQRLVLFSGKHSPWVQSEIDRFCQESKSGRCVAAGDQDFIPSDPTQRWTDLVAAGMDPQQIKVLSSGAEEALQVERVLALVLGARVGLVDEPAPPEDRKVIDASWDHHPSFVRLPKDAMTIRAFLWVDELPCTDVQRRQFDKAAQRSHEDYLHSVTPKDPSHQPWANLPEDLKISNYHQVIYAESILHSEGLGVRPLKEPEAALLDMKATIGMDGIRRLAELEHGRWNVERLLLGWTYAPEKDAMNKRSPYLIPWDHLTEQVRQYDIDAVIGLPAKFREAGLDVYRLEP